MKIERRKRRREEDEEIVGVECKERRLVPAAKVESGDAGRRAQREEEKRGGASVHSEKNLCSDWEEGRVGGVDCVPAHRGGRSSRRETGSESQEGEEGQEGQEGQEKSNRGR